jgi:hypothetical protein
MIDRTRVIHKPQRSVINIEKNNTNVFDYALAGLTFAIAMVKQHY